MIGDALSVAFLVVAPLPAGAALGYAVDAALQLRALRRTGHVLYCPGLGGWTCDCRDSEPAPGRLRGRGPEDRAAPGLLVLLDAGPPPARDRARLPGLRPPGRAVDTSSRRH